MQTVCLVGKPNVGKSSIFNRLIKENKSIIMDTPGVTRDRIYGKVEYNNKRFHLIDTGGISFGDDDFQKDILAQATLAIDEADLVLFVVDGIEDIDASDRKVAEILHRTSKPVIVVVNKLDNDKRKDNLYNFYELGFSELIAVSASHNIGINELVNTITKDLPEEDIVDDNTIKFSIIGRPNVGKSSLINAILNEDRAIVSDIAGTTRDAIDTKFKYNHEDITVIDTAGMRKKGKIYESVEKYSLIRSLKAIDRSDVCVLVIDASTGIIEHDKHIASYALDAGKGIVICVNKWDTINNPDSDIRHWKEEIKNEFQFIPYAHVVFLSAKTKKRVSTLMPEVINAYNNNRKEVKTSLLNNIIMEAVSLHEPPSYKGKRLKIYFVSQTGNCPPKFTFSVNNKGLVHFSYERYLENQIRNNIDFDGTPIILQFKNKSE
ncbi:MAG: ribosome biogenesis GTPase Der [Firmicutes bacterium]|jgi:ribosome-associated GTPase engA|nr:ribosome biogenesis GTPase Der [Bacillota bacterium]